MSRDGGRKGGRRGEEREGCNTGQGNLLIEPRNLGWVNGKWEMGNRKWDVGRGKWEVGSGIRERKRAMSRP